MPGASFLLVKRYATLLPHKISTLPVGCVVTAQKDTSTAKGCPLQSRARRARTTTRWYSTSSTRLGRQHEGKSEEPQRGGQKTADNPPYTSVLQINANTRTGPIRPRSAIASMEKQREWNREASRQPARSSALTPQTTRTREVGRGTECPPSHFTTRAV
ncbi:hypothetical protein JB92DRAFT_2838959 [Gautieria morchelliformis]|nr:hypothetical protein JB92DRAFT_2838959 [Gautieria morchelliformis]